MPRAPRALRPRATQTLVVAPATVTDLTAPAVIGLEARTFREFVGREHVPHARLGHRIVARVDDVLAALDRVARRAKDDKPASDEPAPDGDEQPETVDGVLAALGKERVR